MALPVCFYPMRKLILDDDLAFAQSVLLKMHDKHFTTHHSPKELLRYLLEEYTPTLTKNQIINQDLSSSGSPTEHVIEIDLDKLKQHLSYPVHPDINILVIDYHMPEMNGVEFLEKIKHLTVKKILVTAENDYTIAVDAFNSGLVDAYIRKDDPNFAYKLQRLVSELEWEYFVDLSSVMTHPGLDFLANEDLTSTYKNYFSDNGIQAFCLSHIRGDFIVRNESNKNQSILIRSSNQLKELAQIAEDDGGSEETIINLKNAKVIPHFGVREHWEVPASEWGSYLIPITHKIGANLMWAIK